MVLLAFFSGKGIELQSAAASRILDLAFSFDDTK
jgi:hypothetical protein